MNDNRLTNSTRIMAIVGFLYFGWAEFMVLLRNNWYKETGESGLAVLHASVMVALVGVALVLIFGIKRKAFLAWFWCIPPFGYLWAMLDSRINIWWIIAQMVLTLIMVVLTLLGTFNVCRKKAAVVVRFAILFAFLGYIISTVVYYFIEDKSLGGMAYYLCWEVLLYLTVVNTCDVYRPLAAVSRYFYFLPAVLALIYVVSVWKDSYISSNLTRIVYSLPYIIVVLAALAYGYFITDIAGEDGLKSLTKDRMSFLNTTLVAIPVLASVVLSLVGTDMYNKDIGVISEKATVAYHVLMRADEYYWDESLGEYGYVNMRDLKYSIASIDNDAPPVLFLAGGLMSEPSGDTRIIVYEPESGKTVTVWGDEYAMRVEGYVAKDNAHSVPAFVCRGLHQSVFMEEIYEFYDGKLHLKARKDVIEDDGSPNPDTYVWDGEEVSMEVYNRNFDAYCANYREIVWEEII